MTIAATAPNTSAIALPPAAKLDAELPVWLGEAPVVVPWKPAPPVVSDAVWLAVEDDRVRVAWLMVALRVIEVMFPAETG